jgi:hypothetical protein
VTFTIRGTVSTGTDGTGVFGFAPGTSLAGLPFVLVYTFDDTKGTEQVSSGKVPYGSSVTGIGPTSPGTAVLQIGNGSFSFGTPTVNVSSTAYRYVIPAGGDIGDFPTVWESVTDDGTIVTMNVEQAATSPPMTSNYDWRAPFSYTLMPNDLRSAGGDSGGLS